MSSAPQRLPYYEQERVLKEASSDASSPHDVYGSAASTAASSTTPAKRGIRHLTPAQLAKKRANDRDSQRAIRERTKKQIETLESRINELESGTAYQQLDTIIKEKEALQAENDEIRAKLASVLAILQPIIDGRVGGLSITVSTLDTDPQASHAPKESTQAGITARPDHAQSTSALDPMLLEPSHPHQVKPPHYQAPLPVTNYHTPSTQWSQSGVLVNPSEAQYASGGIRSRENEDNALHPSTERRRPIQRGQYPPYQATSVPNSPLPWPFPMTPQERPVTAMGTHHEEHASIVRTPEEPPAVHTQRPNNIRPTSHFDSIIADFTTDARQRLSAGASLQDIIGPPDPDLTLYLFPTLSHYISPIMSLLSDIVRTYSAIRRLPEKISILMNLFTYLRWLIQPSFDNYHAMPEFMRPTEAQVRVPHPIWVDVVPWPAMRAKLVSGHSSVSLDNFFVPFTLTLSINWPGNDDADSCLYQPEGGQTVCMAPAMRRHWMHIENYSLGLEFARNFPMLADTCRIVDDEGRDVRVRG